MLRDLVVVAAHGFEHIESCLDSLGDRYDVLVVDTGSDLPIVLADRDHTQLHRMPYQTYITGAILWAYENVEARNYLFIQDSMRALTHDYVEPFRERQPERGCVAWATFTDGMLETPRSGEEFGQYFYPIETYPPYAIFGSIFYANRTSLDELAQRHLMPLVPRNKMHCMATERLWSWAFHTAGMTVDSIRGQWDHPRMMSGDFPPFSKTWSDRQ